MNKRKNKREREREKVIYLDRERERLRMKREREREVKNSFIQKNKRGLNRIPARTRIIAHFNQLHYRW